MSTTQQELFDAYVAQFRDASDDARFVETISARNPWSKSHFNLTSQMRVHRLDANLAERLQGEAFAAELKGTTH